MPLENIIGEMNAFLADRPNCFASVLSSATTEQIEQFNGYLLEIVVASQAGMQTAGTEATDRLNAHASRPLPAGQSGAQAVDEGGGSFGFFETGKDNPAPSSLPLEGEWSALSSSDLTAMKIRIDQQLSTVRMELQAFFGLFTDDMVSEAVTALNALCVLDLIEGAKHKTSSLMALLSAQQSFESSLVDDVLSSMTHLMDTESLVTADDPLEGLMEALQLDALQRHGNLLDLFGPTVAGGVTPAVSPRPAGAGPQSYQEAEALKLCAKQHGANENLTPVLINQVQSMSPVIDIDHAGRFSLLPAPGTLAALPDKALSISLPSPNQPASDQPKAGTDGEKLL